jgi:hypothetical protein
MYEVLKKFILECHITIFKLAQSLEKCNNKKNYLVIKQCPRIENQKMEAVVVVKQPV